MIKYNFLFETRVDFSLLKHNFFADIAAMLPKTYTSSAPTDQSDSQKIAKLELEITILKAEKAVLLQAMGNK